MCGVMTPHLAPLSTTNKYSPNQQPSTLSPHPPCLPKHLPPLLAYEAGTSTASLMSTLQLKISSHFAGGTGNFCLKFSKEGSMVIDVFKTMEELSK